MYIVLHGTTFVMTFNIFSVSFIKVVQTCHERIQKHGIQIQDSVKILPYCGVNIRKEVIKPWKPKWLMLVTVIYSLSASFDKRCIKNAK